MLHTMEAHRTNCSSVRSFVCRLRDYLAAVRSFVHCLHCSFQATLHSSTTTVDAALSHHSHLTTVPTTTHRTALHCPSEHSHGQTPRLHDVHDCTTTTTTSNLAQQSVGRSPNRTNPTANATPSLSLSLTHTLNVSISTTSQISMALYAEFECNIKSRYYGHLFVRESGSQPVSQPAGQSADAIMSKSDFLHRDLFSVRVHADDFAATFSGRFGDAAEEVDAKRVKWSKCVLCCVVLFVVVLCCRFALIRFGEPRKCSSLRAYLTVHQLDFSMH